MGNTKEYITKNKDKIKNYQKIWRQNNPGYNDQYYHKNKEKFKKYQKDWYDTHKEYYNGLYLKKYNISLEEYNSLFDSQNGCCAICGIHQSNVNKSFAIDHNHETNKIRGLLCNKCNRGIGFLCDSVNLLEKAITYLNTY